MSDDGFDAALRLVSTTVGSMDAARELARLVLEHRLAACVHVRQVTSYYRWQGARHEDAEWQLVCKTTVEAASALAEFLRARHPYTLPEIVITRAEASAAYAEWVREALA